jgi:endonuclease/exonuclease/phosphatase family metal-dependent hydrolase
VPPTPDRRPTWRPSRSRVPRAVALTYGALATLGMLLVLALSDGRTVSYVLGLFAVWWTAPALVLVPVAAALGWWRVLASVLVPAVAAGSVFGPLFLNRLSPVDVTPDLRIATFNTSSWAGADGLQRLVEGADPDVLALQEVAPGQQRGYAQRFAQYPYRSYSAVADGTWDGDAVWSKFPIVSVEAVTGLPDGARPADVVTLDVEGHEVAVLSVHLASPCLFCTPYEASLNPAGNTGNAARVRVGEAQRYAEIASDLRARGAVVVLAGDLNSAEFNEPLREMRSHGLVDVQRAVGTKPGLTRGSSPGFARVDVVLVDGLVPVASQERDPGGSTHSPVVADLAWPTP